MNQTMSHDPGPPATVEARAVPVVYADSMHYTADGTAQLAKALWPKVFAPPPSVEPCNLVVGQAARPQWWPKDDAYPSNQQAPIDIYLADLRHRQASAEQLAAQRGERPYSQWPKVFAPPPTQPPVAPQVHHNDPSVWDLPDPAVRGASKMQDAIVETIRNRAAYAGGVEGLILQTLANDILRELDPAKVVEA